MFQLFCIYVASVSSRCCIDMVLWDPSAAATCCSCWAHLYARGCARAPRCERGPQYGHGTRSGVGYGAGAGHGATWPPMRNSCSKRGRRDASPCELPGARHSVFIFFSFERFPVGRAANSDAHKIFRYEIRTTRGADWDDIPCRVPPLGAGRTDDGSSASACQPMGDGRWLIHRCSKLDGARATDRLATRDTDQPPAWLCCRAIHVYVPTCTCIHTCVVWTCSHPRTLPTIGHVV
jgi:hypothetical protein